MTLELECREGRGPVALRLLERDALHLLSNQWRDKHQKTLLPKLLPSAQQLIEWTRPYKGDTKVFDIIKVLSKYYSFYHQSHPRVTPRVLYFATKPIKKYNYKSNYNNNILSIDLKSLSGTVATLRIDFAHIQKSSDLWCKVTIFDGLERISYPGDISNVDISSFQNEFESLMLDTGWDESEYQTIINENKIDLNSNSEYLETVTKEMKSFITNSPLPFESPGLRDSFKRVWIDYQSNGIGYSEYKDSVDIYWTFMSKEYQCDSACYSFVFTGCQLSNKITCSFVENTAFNDNPSKEYRNSLNVYGHQALFEPTAYVYFVEQWVAARQTLLDSKY